jgi:quinoprotein glucose dehydrogenase
MLAALFALAQSATAPYEPKIAPASDEGKAACARIQVPAGFQVELWAAEPLLANPVCLYPYWRDGKPGFLVAETFRHHKGVTDIRDHMDWLDEDVVNQVRDIPDPEARLRETIRRHAALTACASPDRPARPEWHGPPTRRSSPTASDARDGHRRRLARLDGDVYYTCIPDLWKLADRDGDGKAEFRELLSTGYGLHVALLGHDLHGLRIGPDGKLYFSSGDRALHVETKEGLVENWKSGSVLRCDLDGTHLEIYATGLRNPQDLVFDAYGNLFTGDNNSDGGDSARWVQVIQGGDSGWRYSYQWLVEPVLRGPWNDEKLWYPHFEGQAAYSSRRCRLRTGLQVAAYPGSGFGDVEGTILPLRFPGHGRIQRRDSFRLEPRARRSSSSTPSTSPGDCARRTATSLPTERCTCRLDRGLGRREGPDLPCRLDGAPPDPIVLEVGGSQPKDRRIGPSRNWRASSRSGPASAGRPSRARAPREGRRRGLEWAAPGGAIREAARIWGLGVVAAHEPAASREAARAAHVLELLGDADPEVRAQSARVLGDREKRAAASLVASWRIPPPACGSSRQSRSGGSATRRRSSPSRSRTHDGRADPTLRTAVVVGSGLRDGRPPARRGEVLRRTCVSSRSSCCAAWGRARRGFLADPRLVRLEAARAVYDEPRAGVPRARPASR